MDTQLAKYGILVIAVVWLSLEIVFIGPSYWTLPPVVVLVLAIAIWRES